MLEEDNEGIGMNSYNIKCEDPSSTNALNTSIYLEINEIKNVLQFYIKLEIYQLSKDN